jgi:hypothetical protein
MESENSTFVTNDKEEKLFMIFDTETTGLLVNKKKANNNDCKNNQAINIENPTEEDPYIVQLSYILVSVISTNDVSVNPCITIKKIVDNIIKVPDNVNINEIAVSIHGISKEMSSKKGITIIKAMNEFMKDIKKVDLIIAHNAIFDLKMISIELNRILRLCLPSNRSYKKIQENIDFINNVKNVYCTMMSNIKICNIKSINKNGKEYVKFPKLCELHQHLFQSVPNNLHNSLIDVIVCLRCFIKTTYNVDIFENCKHKIYRELKSLL